MDSAWQLGGETEPPKGECLDCDGANLNVICKKGGDPLAAAIDKNFATELLAEQIDADALVILTEVEKVDISQSKPNQESLDALMIVERNVVADRCPRRCVVFSGGIPLMFRKVRGKIQKNTL